MRTLAHLSDLHFGRVDDALLQPLVDAVHAARPDVVVVSGDLTQRARSAEFEAAAAFLARLPGPQVVVPGNHDVPLYNVAARLLTPLDKFHRYIESDPLPRHVDDEVAVVGLNSARSLVVKNGRVNREQLAAVQALLAPLPDTVFKVVVTHHPFEAEDGVDSRELIGRARLAMAAFAAAGVDLLLAGHRHVSVATDTGERYRDDGRDGYAALVVSAGTATSTRERGESNAFNVVRIDGARVAVERHAWMPESGRFERAGVEVFERAGGGWTRVAGEPAAA